MARERGTDYRTGYEDGYRDGYEKGCASPEENRGMDLLPSPSSVPGASSSKTRLEAVRELSRLSLPVGDPEEMERESVPEPEDLLP
ncbi:MAG TPA: hypothetical protein VLT87_08725 [Thermoanaerobaculia bacterium]|nr:hypothetical protein [Thermoanaerobaculia bacterium]